MKKLFQLAAILAFAFCSAAFADDADSLAKVRERLAERNIFQNNIDAALAELRKSGFIFEEYFGEVRVRRIEPCSACAGSGSITRTTSEKRARRPCTACGGRGQHVVQGIRGGASGASTCQKCRGRGYIETVTQAARRDTAPCTACNGQGGKLGEPLGSPADLRHAVNGLDEYMSAVEAVEEFDRHSAPVIDELLHDETVRVIPPHIFQQMMKMRMPANPAGSGFRERRRQKPDETFILAICRVVARLPEPTGATYVLEGISDSSTYKIYVERENNTAAESVGAYMILRGHINQKLGPTAVELIDAATYPPLETIDAEPEPDTPNDADGEQEENPDEQMSQKQARWKLSLAKNYIDAGHREPAIKALDEIIQKFPDSPEATEAKSLKQSLGK